MYFQTRRFLFNGLDSLQKLINDKNIILRPDAAVQKAFDNWVPYKDDNGEEINF
jgi:hypothetical protein